MKKLIAIGFSLLALYLRFMRLLQRDLWMDEVYQLHYMVGKFKLFWLNTYNYGDHTTFAGDYVLCYPFIQISAENKWILAIPHILITILGFYFLYKLCQRYYKSAWSYAIAFAIVCFNNELIFHSFEFRPYAVLPTLALGSFYFADLITTNWLTISRKNKFFIGLFFAFVAFYHMYGIAMLYTSFIFVIFTRRSKASLWYFFWVSSISLAIWYWYASVNLYGLEFGGILKQTQADTFQFINNPLINPLGFAKDIFGNLIGYYKPMYIFFLGLPIMFLSREKVGFFLVMIVLPITLIFVSDVFASNLFIQRQFGWVMPSFAFLLGWCFDFKKDETLN